MYMPSPARRDAQVFLSHVSLLASQATLEARGWSYSGLLWSGVGWEASEWSYYWSMATISPFRADQIGESTSEDWRL